MRRTVFFRLRLRLQNTTLYLTPILSLNLEHKLESGQGLLAMIDAGYEMGAGDIAKRMS